MDMSCHLCFGRDLSLFKSFSSLARAGSDCRPWPKGGMLSICNRCRVVQKIIDGQWRAEVKDIYANYDLYHQSPNAKEQRVFNAENGQSLPRSQAILQYVQQEVDIVSSGHFIDLGCGVGNMLKSFAEQFVEAKLHGFEPNAHQQQALEKIKNVVSIYTDLQQIQQQQFNLLTMIHVLEHIDSPATILESLKKYIADDGYLVIVVPDYTTNPFDLIIADHASHFSSETLSNLLRVVGFDIIRISNTVINKEIIAICRTNQSKNKTVMPDAIDDKRLVQDQLGWMNAILRDAKKIAKKNRPFGIFGTSIAANWIYGELIGLIDFFVDEDLDRTDRLYHNKPVYSVSNVPDDSHVYVCLQPNVLSSIISRIESNRFKLYAPPVLSSS